MEVGIAPGPALPRGTAAAASQKTRSTRSTRDEQAKTSKKTSASNKQTATVSSKPVKSHPASSSSGKKKDHTKDKGGSAPKARHEGANDAREELSEEAELRKKIKAQTKKNTRDNGKIIDNVEMPKHMLKQGKRKARI